MDAYAKILLTVIAACLMLLVAQGFGLAGTPGPGQVSAGSGETVDRFQMLPIAMARQMFRFDRLTGQTWTMPLQLEADRFWTPVDESPPKAKARRRPKKAPSEPKKKAGGAEKGAGETEKGAGGAEG
jgi:hypothetical protein